MEMSRLRYACLGPTTALLSPEHIPLNGAWIDSVDGDARAPMQVAVCRAGRQCRAFSTAPWRLTQLRSTCHDIPAPSLHTYRLLDEMLPACTCAWGLEEGHTAEPGPTETLEVPPPDCSHHTQGEGSRVHRSSEHRREGRGQGAPGRHRGPPLPGRCPPAPPPPAATRALAQGPPPFRFPRNLFKQDSLHIGGRMPLEG
jgi:hypothetical protein